MAAYEVSNHAKTGQASLHNQIYWIAGDWGGIGPGAHGRLTRGATRFATETRLAPKDWLKAADSGSGENSRDVLSARDAASEYLMMGLRTDHGIDVGRITALVDTDFIRKINTLEELGLVIYEAERLVTTHTGRPILNAVIRELLPD